ncbi:MAG: hypothetical protein Q9203_003406 [Teloschistes exilis]
MPLKRWFQGLGSPSPVPVAEEMGGAAPGTQAVESSLKPSDRSTQDIVDEAGQVMDRRKPLLRQLGEDLGKQGMVRDRIRQINESNAWFNPTAAHGDTKNGQDRMKIRRL